MKAAKRSEVALRPQPAGLGFEQIEPPGKESDDHAMRSRKHEVRIGGRARPCRDRGLPGVEAPAPLSPAPRPPAFGSDALPVDSKILAMVSRGQLVLKLPAHRVAGLIGSGRGDPYDAGKGSPMREWVALDPDRQDDWIALATEAMEFVRTARAVRTK